MPLGAKWTVLKNAAESELVTWLDLGAESPQALHARLSGRLRALIVSGQLQAGDRLPSERRLAQLLHVSRNTVSTAYQSLIDQGWVESQHGSGTTVAAGPHSKNRTHQVSALFSGHLNRPDGLTNTVDMTLVSPEPWPGVSKCWALVGDELDQWLSRTGYSRAGDPVFRQRLAKHLSEQGLATKPEELLVTAGAQQGLNLIAQLLVQTGDAVITEPHTYPGALDAFRAAGASSHPPESLPLKTGQQPRLIYVISANQNPTGMTLTAAQQTKLIQIASAADAYVLDDLSLVDMRVGNTTKHPKRPLANGMTTKVRPDRLITVGSFSKLYWAGLRLGWVRADPGLINRLVAMKTTADLGAPIPSQALGAHLLNHHASAMTWRSAKLGESVDLTATKLGNDVPDWKFRVPDGGQYFWVELPQDRALDLAHAAANNGALVVPGQLLHPYGHGDRFIRISMAVGVDQLEFGLSRLIETWHAQF